MHSLFAFAAVVLLGIHAAPPAAAQSSCSSDGIGAPAAVLERFISADCESCWRDSATPAARARELALDWIVPSARGDEAPLAAGAARDALARLRKLGREPPQQSESVRTPVTPPPEWLRVAQGLVFNDHIAVSVQLTKPGSRRDVVLLLIEELPKGAEGSPVQRNLVRNMFEASAPDGLLQETRSMRLAQGALPPRLRVVGLSYDERGRLVGATRTPCSAN